MSVYGTFVIDLYDGRRRVGWIESLFCSDTVPKIFVFEFIWWSRKHALADFLVERRAALHEMQRLLVRNSWQSCSNPFPRATRLVASVLPPNRHDLHLMVWRIIVISHCRARGRAPLPQPWTTRSSVEVILEFLSRRGCMVGTPLAKYCNRSRLVSRSLHTG